MAKFNWRCPFCGHHGVIDDDYNQSVFTYDFDMNNKYGKQRIAGVVAVCPNDECREYVLVLSVYDRVWDEARKEYVSEELNHKWQLIPESRAKVFPSYIPEVLLDDYHEACLICDKSPKASATLSRRCLQGIIRDFWGIKKSRLVEEIEAIKDKVDHDTWEAIDAVRKVGNIGAHMEVDINVIVDVDPDEADLLINLLEQLFAEWYVARYERAERMAKVKALAVAKDNAKKAGEPKKQGP